MQRENEVSYPWPVETLRGWYVAPVGGYSRELSWNEIGINRQALFQNTDLRPYLDRVIISKLEGSGILPLFMREQFLVVPLTEAYPEAYSKSRIGEVVLPSRKKNRLMELKIGEEVIINSAINELPPKWIAKFMKRFIS
ncbi:MAG: hypothetical protein QXL78_05895 [Methanocellales archaeon]